MESRHTSAWDGRIAVLGWISALPWLPSAWTQAMLTIHNLCTPCAKTKMQLQAPVTLWLAKEEQRRISSDCPAYPLESLKSGPSVSMTHLLVLPKS